MRNASTGKWFGRIGCHEQFSTPVRAEEEEIRRVKQQSWKRRQQQQQLRLPMNLQRSIVYGKLQGTLARMCC
jgi:hypothetical protein